MQCVIEQLKYKITAALLFVVDISVVIVAAIGSSGVVIIVIIVIMIVVCRRFERKKALARLKLASSLMNSRI